MCSGKYLRCARSRLFQTNCSLLGPLWIKVRPHSCHSRLDHPHGALLLLSYNNKRRGQEILSDLTLEELSNYGFESAKNEWASRSGDLLCMCPVNGARVECLLTYNVCGFECVRFVTGGFLLWPHSIGRLVLASSVLVLPSKSQSCCTI